MALISLPLCIIEKVKEDREDLVLLRNYMSMKQLVENCVYNAIPSVTVAISSFHDTTLYILEHFQTRG